VKTSARLFLLLGLAAARPAGEARPLVRVYDDAEVPARGPVLACATLGDGARAVGSNELSLFDGQKWTVVDLPGAYAFRALAAGTGDRIYVGARGAIGYLEPDDAGTWRFTSLQKDLAAAGVPEAGDIWFAHGTGRGCVFVTSDRVLRWNGSTFEAWSLPSVPALQAAACGGDVLVYQGGVGILRIGAAGRPAIAWRDRDLPERPLSWAVGEAVGPGAAAGARPLLIGLGNDAFRLSPEGRFVRLPELSAALADSVPTCAVAVGGDRAAIGTLRKGVLFAWTDGSVIGRCDSGNGLSDNTVQALSTDPAGDLWTGTGSGLARIEAPGLAGIFGHAEGLEPGSPRKAVMHDGVPYILTSKGLYAVRNASIAPALDNQAVLWDAAEANGRLWVAGFDGVWRVGAAGAERVHSSLTDVFLVAPTHRHPDGVLVIEGYTPKLLVPTRMGLAARVLGVRIGDTPVSMLETPSGSVWISTMVDGIYRLDWDTGPDDRDILRVSAHFADGQGLMQGCRSPALHLVDGRLVAFSDQAILALNPDGTRFEALAQATGYLGIAATDADGDDPAYWLVEPRLRWRTGRKAVLRVSWKPGAAPDLRPVVVPGLEEAGSAAALSLAAGSLWIGGSRGFIEADIRGLEPARDPVEPRLVRIAHGAEPLPVAGRARLPSNAANVEFAFASGDGSAAGPALFQTRLEGADSEWSAPQGPGAKAYSGLSPGSYRFTVRALDRWGRTGPAAAYSFSVASPWWRTWPALAGFGLVVAAAIAEAARWRLGRLRARNERLERLVAERTRELELSNTAKSEFLENISHELRNPLNGMMGMLAMLREDRLGPQERDAARTLKGCAQQMARAFEDVLGFSKLEYGYVKVDERPFSVRTLLEEVAALHAAAARQVGCDLVLEAAAPPPPPRDAGFPQPPGTPAGSPAGPTVGRATGVLIGDAGKIKTIVSNFVGNAIKYAPGAPIEISWEHADGSLLVEVKDRGPGIPPDEQELIFQKFVRGTSAKDARVAGTGMGLATCRVLARHLGGSVGVEVGSDGRGSTFFLRVPVKPAEGRDIPEADLPRAAAPTETEAARPIPEEGRERETERPGTAERAAPSPRALVVDDEDYNRKVLRAIAVELGYDTDATGSAADAIGKIGAASYDVVFLDWELPDGKGGDVARAIRSRRGPSFAGASADGGRAGPVILATTAHDSDEMRHRCLAAGMDGVLLKPYSLERIRDAIARPVRADAEPPQGDAGRPGLNLKAFDLYSRGESVGTEEGGAAFVQALENEHAAMRRAEESGEPMLAGEHAHRLSALSGLIGARPLNEAAKRLQNAPPKLDRAERDGLLDAVSRELEALKHALAEAPGGLGRRLP
jgi:signal transduction histidine kinase/DNA-binding response OmpR family regulator